MLEVARLGQTEGLTGVLHGSDQKTEFFHFLGKLVYAKRVELPAFDLDSERLALESRVPARFARPAAPQTDLDQLVRSSPISGGKVRLQLDPVNLSTTLTLFSWSSTWPNTRSSSWPTCAPPPPSTRTWRWPT